MLLQGRWRRGPGIIDGDDVSEIVGRPTQKNFGIFIAHDGNFGHLHQTSSIPHHLRDIERVLPSDRALLGKRVKTSLGACTELRGSFMEKVNIAGVTLEGFAQGGWQTAIHVPDAHAVFDAGTLLPGVSVDHVFITHGHPDHIGALPSMTARRAIQSSPRRSRPENCLNIHVPEGIRDQVNTALRTIDGIFGDRSQGPFEVFGHSPGDTIRTGQHTVVKAMRTFHGVASCGWAVEKTVSKLKEEFVGKEGREIARLRLKGVEVTDQKTHTMVVIPGDTTIEFLLRQEQARTAKVLLHEVTYWDERSTPAKCRDAGHTHVDEMIEHCEKFEGEALVLVHRSLKYTRAGVEEIVRRRFPSSMQSKIHIFDGGDRKQ